MELTDAQTLAWRLRRHSLVPTQGSLGSTIAPAKNSGVSEAVDRVVALRAWPEQSAEAALRIRGSHSDQGTLADAQESSSIIRSYALRGGSYYFTPSTGANLLSVRTATKIWRSPRYQRQGSFSIDDWEPLREAVREACSSGPRTREEISAHVQTVPSLRHLKAGLSGAGADSLYKPLHWWGDICFGPSRDGQSTFRWLGEDSAWPGLPAVDEAGVQAMRDYVHSYGPVKLDNFHYWFTEGLGVRRAMVREWLTSMEDELVPVTVGDVDAFVLASDLDDIRSTSPEASLLFLPGFDPWLMGPGTSDTRIIASQRRALASRGANTIVANGFVVGVWKVSAHEVRIHWFDEAGPIPRPMLDAQVRALAESERRDLAPVFLGD